MLNYRFAPQPPSRFARAERIANSLGLAADEMAAFLGISPKTLGRRRQSGSLDETETLRIAMLEQMLQLCREVLGSEERARRWLTQPLVGLSGRAPIELLTSIEGYETVRNALYRQAYGMF